MGLVAAVSASGGPGTTDLIASAELRREIAGARAQRQAADGQPAAAIRGSCVLQGRRAGRPVHADSRTASLAWWTQIYTIRNSRKTTGKNPLRPCCVPAGK